MCGIVGNISLGNRKLSNISEVQQMLNIQNHRGPDDRGICLVDFDSERIAEVKSSNHNEGNKVDGIVGFNRLSIRDLSLNGHQPMLSENGKIMLAFNGEIYNAFDYREDLKASGYIFRSNTDSEVILRLYQEYGFDKMISMLNGMFAIVIVDVEKNQVYMARDRFGIKPFYYSIFNDKILFASELKCFLCDSEFEPEIDKESIYEHIIYSGTNSKNLMKNVECLQPGEILNFQFCGRLRKYKFFDINNYTRPQRKKISMRKCKREMETLLRKAVKQQLVSDVKVGCQLSGGIDSTLITTYASEMQQGKLEDTVSVVFDDTNEAFSEEKYIDQVNNTLKLKSHKCVIDKSFVSQNLTKTIWHLDTMANTPNAIGIMQLSEEAKKHVTVLLSGEGADEAMAGYWQLSLAPVLETYWKVRRNKIGHALLHPFRRFDNGALCVKMKDGYENFVVSTFGVVERDTFKKMFMIDSDNADKIYDTVVEERKSLFRNFSGTNFDKHIKYMMTTNLPDLLVRQDKMSMSASIENRVPFLDNSVIEYAFSLPKKMLLKWKINPKRIRAFKLTEGKIVLKELCVNKYGKEFTYRGKRGFDLPLADFLSDESFKTYFNQILIPSMEERAIFNATYAKELYDNLLALDKNESNALWKMVNFEIWCELFIDKRGLEIFGN